MAVLAAGLRAARVAWAVELAFPVRPVRELFWPLFFFPFFTFTPQVPRNILGCGAGSVEAGL